MTNIGYISIQFPMAIIIYLVIYRAYLRDWLQEQSFEQAVLPFLILHVFRYLGLTLLVTGQVSPEVSRSALSAMAWGDLASGVAALAAVLAIRLGSRFSVPLVVLFSIVGIGDLINVGPTALSAGVLDASIGTMWFLMVIYAPALLLSHIYIIYRLFLHFRPNATADQQA